MREICSELVAGILEGNVGKDQVPPFVS